MVDKKLPLSQHLGEMRRRIIFCIIFVIIGSVVSYTYKDKLLDLLSKPIRTLVFIAPQEAFLMFLKLSLLGGVILASPIIIYHICRFVWVAFYSEEKKVFIVYGVMSLLLFLAGIYFAYFIMLPIVTEFLLSFQTRNLIPMISADKYVSYFVFLFFCFSIIFELPLIMMFLTRLNLINPFILSEKRKYVIVAIFVIGAVLTPPDVFTQILMALPLLALFEISLLLSKFVKKRMAG